MTHIRIILSAGLLAVSLAACPGPKNKAFAGGFIQGNELYQRCTSSKASDKAICFGYVTGAFDTVLGFGIFKEATCYPDKLTIEQVADIVVSFLNLKPHIRHYEAPSLIVGALAQAFPCKN